MRAMVPVVVASAMCAALLAARGVAAENSTVVRIDLDNTIQPVSADFVRDGLQWAAEIHAAAAVIRLNTPGGLENSMRDIVKSILNSPVPVIVWIGPGGARAASAGFFILLSADVATMAPGTNTGAAHPVAMGGVEIGDVMEKKIVSDAAAFLRSYSSKRGRNAELAEKAVTESLSFTEAEALRDHLIDAVAKDIPALLEKLDEKEVRRFDDRMQSLSLKDATVETYEMTMRQKLLSAIMDPNVAFILGILGLLGLYVEFTHPGMILPGVAGGISFILALFAFNLLPINITGVALIVLAIVLFVLEASVTSHGILGIGGSVSMIAGGLMLVEGPIPELRIRLATVLAVTLPFAFITVFLLRLVLRSQRARASTGASGMIGSAAMARTAIHKTGKVTIGGEIWNAWSRSPIPKGSEVEVVGIEGLQLEVRAQSEDKT